MHILFAISTIAVCYIVLLCEVCLAEKVDNSLVEDPVTGMRKTPKKCYHVCQEGACVYDGCVNVQCPGGACLFRKTTGASCTGHFEWSFYRIYFWKNCHIHLSILWLISNDRRFMYIWGIEVIHMWWRKVRFFTNALTIILNRFMVCYLRFDWYTTAAHSLGQRIRWKQDTAMEATALWMENHTQTSHHTWRFNDNHLTAIFMTCTAYTITFEINCFQ